MSEGEIQREKKRDRERRKEGHTESINIRVHQKGSDPIKWCREKGFEPLFSPHLIYDRLAVLLLCVCVRVCVCV